MSKKRIVVLGGGTGTFTALTGLKQHPIEIAAIVSVADNGGSTGILRDELGVLPPGDIRQCLVALSAGDDILRNLFNYRFHEGSLSGQSFGNLFLSALEKITGDPLSAVREAHLILNVRGRVIPVSSTASNLFAELEDGTVVEGEHRIDTVMHGARIRRCFLSPSVSANPEAIRAIEGADAIILGPGDIYTSLIPVLLVDSIREALVSSSAKKIYVISLVTKKGQTDGFTARSYCDTISSYLAPTILDGVVVNSAKPSEDVLKKYEISGDHLVVDDLDGGTFHVVRVPLIAGSVAEHVVGDGLSRSLLRHDPAKLAETILSLI